MRFIDFCGGFVAHNSAGTPGGTVVKRRDLLTPGSCFESSKGGFFSRKMRCRKRQLDFAEFDASGPGKKMRNYSRHKTKARTVVGAVEECPLCDSGFESLLGGGVGV